MKSVLITGGSGLLGKKLESFLEKDFCVYSLKRSENQIFTHNDILVDLNTQLDVLKLPKQVDVIIHNAQSQHFKNPANYASDIFGVNTYSTFNLLEYARIAKVKKFIYFSTGGLYRPKESPIHESDELLDASELKLYGLSKKLSEDICANYRNFFDITVVRPFFIYGKGQRSDMLLPSLLNKLESGGSIELAGLNGIQVNPIHVNDAAFATLNIMENYNGSVINLAGIDPVSIRRIVELLADLKGLEPHFSFIAPGGDLVANIENLKCLIPQYKWKKVSEGLEDFVRG